MSFFPPYLDWISLEKAESAYYLYRNWSKSRLPLQKNLCGQTDTKFLDMCGQTDAKFLDMCGQTDTKFLDMCGQTDTKFLDMCGQTDTKILPTEKVETREKKEEK